MWADVREESYSSVLVFECIYWRCCLFAIALREVVGGDGNNGGNDGVFCGRVLPVGDVCLHGF